MIEYETRRTTVREVDESTEPAEFLSLANGNPKWLDANTLRTGVQAWELETPSDTCGRRAWPRTRTVSLPAPPQDGS